MSKNEKQRYAVIGWPVAHSLSPPMQQAAFDALRLPARYERIACRPDKLEDCLKRLVDDGFIGWNVTVPHKEAVYELMDELSDTAREACSVNTVVNQDGRLKGYSTDGYGLLRALQESFDFRVDGAHVAFIGCGGAARAAASYLVRHGVARITLINRTRSKAEDLASTLASIDENCLIEVVPPSEVATLQAALAPRPLIIQATSLGLKPDDPLPLDPNLIPIGANIFDMIYTPTPFLKAIRHRDGHAADGRGMLLHQGARSFSLWSGRKAPVEAMRTALNHAIAARNTQ